MSDMSGHVAPQRDELHTLTLRDLEAQVAAAGVVISRRQLMRHCMGGTFDAKKLPAVNNVLEWFITPESVEKGIADIKTLQEQRARRDASRPDTSGHDGVEVSNSDETDTPGHVAPQRDMSDKEESQPGSATDPVTSGYVQQLEKRIEEKDAFIGILKQQLDVKDQQITRHSERERETNLLIRGLQNLVLRLQPGRASNADVFDGDPLMKDREGGSTGNL